MERAFKYQGLGNDFVLVDRRASGRDIDAPTAVRWCDRRRGVGADGVLVLLPAEGAAARMVVHNADGSIAEMCGNGLRCVVKHVVEASPERPSSVKVATGAGVLASHVRYEGGRVADVDVDMGPARWTAPNLPKGGWVEAPVPGFPELQGTAVSMGNPHLVLFGRPLEEAPALGPRLERHPDFPERTNVEWVQVEGATLRLVVWERGVGLTQACGTGACAAVAAAVRLGKAPGDAWQAVALPGGRLEIRVAKDDSAVRMRGPAELVFELGLP